MQELGQELGQELWVVLGAFAALAVLAIVLGVALLRLRARTVDQLAEARVAAAELQIRLEEIEQRLAAQPVATDPVPVGEFTITGLGLPEADLPAPQIDRTLFADLVLRETVVKAASLAHGVRRALAPEVRNRIRFEMRREVKRARKQRRADTREAVREWEARQRAEVGDEDAA